MPGILPELAPRPPPPAAAKTATYRVAVGIKWRSLVN
jgi:hypothetical protein